MRLLHICLVLSLAALMLGSVNSQTVDSLANDSQATATDDTPKQLNVLFIGNSYTARHNLVDVVKAMAEAGNPGLEFKPTSIIYGGRTLADHWQMQTQNFARLHLLTDGQQRSSVDEFKAALARDPQNRNLNSAYNRQNDLLQQLNNNTLQRTKWDWIVLQSYRDDLDGTNSLYAQYARKFAEIAKAQGAARVALRDHAHNAERRAADDRPGRGSGHEQGP